MVMINVAHVVDGIVMFLNSIFVFEKLLFFLRRLAVVKIFIGLSSVCPWAHAKHRILYF